MRSSQWLVEGSGSIMPSGKSSAGPKLHSGASAMSSKLPFDESCLASTLGYRSGGRAVSRLLRSIVDIDDHHTWFSRPPELLQAVRTCSSRGFSSSLSPETYAALTASQSRRIPYIRSFRHDEASGKGREWLFGGVWWSCLQPSPAKRPPGVADTGARRAGTRPETECRLPPTIGSRMPERLSFAKSVATRPVAGNG